MARREITQFIDDIDNTPLSESEVNSIRFSIDGSSYVLDLSEKNAAEFRELLAPYVKVASPAPSSRRSGSRRSGSRSSGGAKRSNSRAIREWAQAQGLKVADRGTIPSHIVDAYNEAHQK